ncbi:MAG TPA: glycerate kinase [Labilithrix sp.]|nr:glycerate kinase [Labilithrix sp.]
MPAPLLPVAPRHSADTAARIHDASQILTAGLEAVDPRAAVRAALRRRDESLDIGGAVFDLPELDRIFVVGGGKAAAAMTLGVLDVLDARVTGGIINVKDGHRGALHDPRIAVHEASHPWPDERGVTGTRSIAQLLEMTTARDLVVVVISGGASALLELPPPGVSVEDLRALTDALLRSGAAIDEINVVRKHVSDVKGGQLAGWAAPAKVLALVLVDVVGAPLDVVASGPTVADPSTFADAVAVLRKYDVQTQAPRSIVEHLARGAAGEILETAKPGDPRVDPDRVTTVVVGDVATACEAASRRARELGYDTALMTTFLEGEAREVAKVVCSIAREVAEHGRPNRTPAAILFGGETTVTVRGSGRGGRNQELALASAIALRGRERTLVVSLATDGSDGPTDAAGGLATGDSLEEGTRRGIDAYARLADNDAYPFLHAVGDLVVTGPTGTNVCDLVLALVW